MKINPQSDAALQEIAWLTKLLDNQFTVPGTRFRFGLDAILGLIPGVGDITGLAVSGYLMLRMIRYGASGYVVSRMLFNILLDAVIGVVPVLGDIFDFTYKANSRNLRLMEQHFGEQKYQGSAWRLIIPILLILCMMLVAIAWVFATLIHSL